jgi:hypothetical protein
MRRVLFILGAVALWLAFAAPAQAVTWDYCYSSLRGGGSLTPDHDIRDWWEVIERNHGQLSHTEHAWWNGPSGSYQVTEAVRYYYQAGGSITLAFSCKGSGGSYVDWRSG